MSVLLLFACAPGTPSNVDVSPDLAVETPPGVSLVAPPDLRGQSAREEVLAVDFLDDIDGFVELTPFREQAGELVWTGAPLDVRAIGQIVLEIPLPDAPPPQDRGASTADPVTYAIAVRSADADGAPGVYTGLSEAQLVYVSTPTDGASLGWNLMYDYEGTTIWRALSRGLTLSENLVGPGRLDLSGDVTLPVGPDTRFALTTLDDVTVAEGPLANDWTVTLAAPPPTQALAVDRGLPGTIVYLQTYEDQGADAVRTDEALVGEGCLDAAPVAVTWFAYTQDLRLARILFDRGLRSGWDLVRQTDEALLPVAASDYTSIVLATSCE